MLRGNNEHLYDYIALDPCERGNAEFEHGWHKWQVEEIVEMFKQGRNILDVAREYKRDPDEVLILAIDLGRRRKNFSAPRALLGVWNG